MSPEPLRLLVLTPTETLLDVGEVQRVQARLIDGGGIGVLPGHAPLIAQTVEAPLVYADQRGDHALDLEAGILYIRQGRVTLLTSGAARSEGAEEDAEPGRGTPDRRPAG